MPSTRGAKKSLKDQQAQEQIEGDRESNVAQVELNQAEEDVQSPKTAQKMTMEERTERMKELRKKMADSSKANRRAVASEANQHKKGYRQSLQAQRRMEKAEKILDERDAKEKGDDWERIKAWNYTIEDNDRWEEQLESKEERRDKGQLDANSASERTYRRLVSQIKPDAKARPEQRHATSSSVGSSSGGQVVRKEDLYADANNLSYGSHKPDESALDRVTAHLNAETEIRSKRSRQRPEDPDEDVTYINEKNKHYNKKIKRFFDKYTTEIRENFERGTAL